MKTVDIESCIWRLSHENGIGWVLQHKPTKTVKPIPKPEYTPGHLASISEREFNVTMRKIFDVQ